MKYKKSEISAGHIIEAATRVIAQKGYAHTSLMDIAKEAGMSKGAVHYHYPTKEALIAKVLETACDVVAERTLKAWNQSGGDPLEGIRLSLRELWRVRSERTNETAVVADLLAQSLHDERLRAPLASFYRFAADQTATHLTGTLEGMGMKPKVPVELLPRILIGLLDGLVMQQFVEPDVIKEDDVISTIEFIATSLFEFKPPA